MANAVDPLKSLNCDSQSLVTFISRTRRPFCVYWLDYHGRRVKYCELNYAQQFNVRTYETHPWIFRDSETGDSLVTADGSEVYMPKRWDGGNADRVIIGIPGWFFSQLFIRDLMQCLNRDDRRSEHCCENIQCKAFC